MGGWFATIGHDIRFGSRVLRKNPASTLLAVLVLALGTGANTAVFSIFHAVLFRPLPFPDPDRVMFIFEKIPQRGVNRSDLCAANYFDVRQRTRTFEGLSLLSGRSFAVAGDLPAEQIPGALVSSSFFAVLGVQPERGRTFRTEDENPGAPPVVILSDSLWRRRFGGDAGVIGKTILLNARSHQVVGIMPRGFQAIFADHELWAPLQLTPAERSDRGSHYLWAIGRLKSGVLQAQSELDAIGLGLEREFPQANVGRGLTAVSVRDQLVGERKAVLVLLMGAVGLVLLVACVNVANVLLARALTRRRELVIRRALGAGGDRILQQLLTEGILLTLCGAAGGLLVAGTVIRWLPRMIPKAASLPGLDQARIDFPVLTVVLGTAALISVFLGCIPAWQSFKFSLNTLNQRTATASKESHRLRSALLATQVAFSLVLLLGTGLFLRSFINLTHVPAGFRTDRLLTVPLQTPSQPVTFLRQVQERVRAIPGVERVAAIEYLPLSGSGVTRRILIEDRPRPAPGAESIVQRHLVTPEYFRTMGIPLVAGRAFVDADMDSKHLVVLISQTMARRHWANRNPLGAYLRVGTQASLATATPREIVGIVGDVRHAGLDRDARDQVYLPLGQDDWPSMQLIVQSRSPDLTSLIPAVKSAVWTIDRNQTLPNIKPMSTIVADSIWQPRLNTVVLSAFAVLSLVLSLAGLYGLMIRIVGDRSAEIGIRMALGARPYKMALLVLSQGLVPVLIGTAAGVGIAVAAGRFLATQLYGVSQTDSLTFASSVSLIVTGAFVAMLHPALRAAKVDPITVIRRE
jgi:putative ABC transport system permease protein